MSPMFIHLGPSSPRATILFAHGSGAPMTSDAMTAIAEALADHDLQVVRFEFEYMAQRRSTGKKRPPPRADKLIPEYHAAIDALGANASGRPLIIGGKSMGGRVATMIADDPRLKHRIRGVLCVGYPFHPIGQPQKLRTEHLRYLQTPTLICQGTRDAFGDRGEISHYSLSAKIHMAFFEDGDHDLAPRKSVTGLTRADHMASMAEITSRWIEQITQK